jgi:uracil-DNA glycosylase family 4
MSSKWERLLDLYDEIDEDPNFKGLRRPGIKLVRGDGAHNVERARVMVIGEAPGAQENGAGKPFVGKSGRVLDGLLALAGFHRCDVFVTNVVKYRPEGNATPSLYDQIKGQEYLREEWAIVQPRLTICVGAVAHQMVSENGSVMSLSATPRGQLWSFGRLEDGSQAWVTSQFHPAFGLRNPKMRPNMERDWGTLWGMCKEVGGILCGLCDGVSAREGVSCDNCHPGMYPEPG